MLATLRHKSIVVVAALPLLLAVAVAGPMPSGAAVRVAPRASIPLSLPALHKVAGYVAAGLKLKVATSGVISQLQNNDLAWVPISSCLATAINSANGTPCVLGDATAPSTVVVLGDSSADEWALYVGALGTADHFRVVVYVHAACPIGNIVVETAGSSPDPTCTTFRSTVLTDLAAMRPAPSLVVASELRLSNYETSSGGTVTNAAWSAALTTTLKEIEADGLAVVALHGVPVVTENPAACIASNPKNLTACTTPLKKDDPGTYDAATASGASGAGAGGIDLHPLFCTSGGCPAVSDGAVTHSGPNHVTERYAADVEAALGELLGCEVAQKFTNSTKATAVFADLNGAKPKAAYLTACKALSH
jgi:hypothetical protein